MGFWHTVGTWLSVNQFHRGPTVPAVVILTPTITFVVTAVSL